MNNKYNRTVIGIDGRYCIVDVYRVLETFDVVNPQLQYIVKKSLIYGLQGQESSIEDLIDIKDSIESAILMHKQIEDLGK